MDVRSIVGIAVASLFAAACSSSTEPEPRVELGVIDYYGEPVQIETPDTVDAGVPFEVSVTTYGGGCVTRDGTQVETEAGTVHVRPFDRHSGHAVCTDELKILEHVASITLDTPGTATIVFHGAAMPGEAPVTFDRSVYVR